MRKRIVSCAMAFLMVFTLMPCSAFAGEASAEGQAESLEAERPAEDDAFGEGGLDEAFFAEDADSLIGTLEADEESAAFAVSAVTGISFLQVCIRLQEQRTGTLAERQSIGIPLAAI